MTDEAGGSGAGALVTGGGSGIARAACDILAGHGYRVAVVDVDGQAAAETATELNAHYGADSASAFPCDVSDGAAVATTVADAVGWAGSLALAINAAAVEGPGRRMADYPDEDWHRVIAVNLTGVWHSTKQELVHMLAGGGGAIVNVSSTAGLGGAPRMSAYAAAKHGVIGLTRTAALEYGRSGVRVNAVCPGFTLTPMIDRFTGGSDEILERMAASSPLGRGADPREVAEAAVWLASPAASYVNGAVLSADGGFTAG